MLFLLLTAENDYLKAISRNVDHWELNTPAVLLLIFVGCAVLGAMCLHLVLTRLRSLRTPEQPIFTLTDQDEILSILIKALDNRSNFELSLPAGNTNPLVCTLTDVHYSCLALELPAYITPSETWIDREVQIYFAIPADGSRRDHYFFQSEILDLFQGDIENVCILISYPPFLQQKQKRSHLRLDPPPDRIASLTLWPASYTHNSSLETDINRFGQPLLEYPGQTTNTHQIRIMDISASGLRLKIPKNSRKKAGITSDNFKECIIALTLVGQEEGQQQSHTVYCRTKNMYDDTMTQDLQVGLQFSAIGQTNPQWPHHLIWDKVDPEHGVEEIGNWVIKLHLKLYREKGIIE